RSVDQATEIAGLEPGLVEVWRRRGFAYVRQTLRLTEGENVLPSGLDHNERRVQLDVRDAKGQPCDSHVWLVPALGDPVRQPGSALEIWLSKPGSQADSRSGLHEWTLPPGRYHVGVETAGDLTHHEEIEVREDRTFEIRVPEVRSVRLRLHRRGEPAAGQEVCISRTDVPALAGVQPCVHVCTDSAGFAELELPEGEYAVFLPLRPPHPFVVDSSTQSIDFDVESRPRFGDR
ncbi:MAG: hypothetical protein AAF488_14190, partial [Planctomycetota bacterium]